MTPPRQQAQDRVVTIGDRQLTLRLGFRALLTLKDHWGCATDADLLDRMAREQLDDAIDILWAAALAHQREMTRDDMLDLIDDAGFVGVTTILRDLIQASMPPPAPPEAGAA